MSKVLTPPGMELAVSAPTAVLDNAHLGDIRGALGTVRVHDHTPRRSWKARFLTLLAIMGPGLVAMVGDNDAGGIATYAQAGQNYGTSLLWTLLLLIPVLIVNQEMVVRLGLVTGVGHARLIVERFGRFWGAFSVGDLFILNFLTIVTEFIGVSMALGYFGVSKYVSVPIAAVVLVATVASGSFPTWERCMYVFIVVSLLMFPLALFVKPDAGALLHDTLVPTVQGGLDSTALLLIISIVGTTVAPWQLFFQQSNVIDKRLTPRWMSYERLDTYLGAILTNAGAAALIVTTGLAFAGTRLMGKFTDAQGVAEGLRDVLGPVAGNLFALVLLDAAIIGAAAVTLSTAYAFGDVFNVKHSLHRSWKDARMFYGSYTVLVLAAASIVLIPGAPLGLITLAVQALAGILLPSATVFLLLLCNDRAVLGPWVNKPWLNVVGSVIVGTLVALSLILAVTTLFPDVNVAILTTVVFVALAGALLFIGAWLLIRQGHGSASDGPALNPTTWRMPPLSELPRPTPSAVRSVGLVTLRGYLVLAALLVAVKVVQLALGS